MEEKKRLNYLDIAKGIAIILVIAGHVGWTHANAFIYSFHMPIFLIISGYLISSDKKLLEVIKRKATQLLIPFYATGAIIIIYKTLFFLICDGFDPAKGALKRETLSMLYANTHYIKYWGIPAIAGTWFFWALFWSSIFTFCLAHLRYYITIPTVILFFFTGYLSSPITALPLCLDLGFVCTGFVYIGHTFRKMNFFKKRIHYIIIIISCIFWAYSIYLGGRLYLVNNHIENGIFSIAGGIGGSIVIIWMSSYIQRFTLPATALAFFGKNSLLIFCIHCLENINFPWSWLNNLTQDSLTPPILFVLKLSLILLTLFAYSFIKNRFITRS